MRRSEKMQPVGDAIVSYSAEALPLDYIRGVHHEVIGEYRAGKRGASSTIQILDLLVRIATTKLAALS